MGFDWSFDLKIELRQSSVCPWYNGQQVTTHHHKPWLQFLGPKTSVSFPLICSLLRFLKSVYIPGNAFFPGEIPNADSQKEHPEGVKRMLHVLYSFYWNALTRGEGKDKSSLASVGFRDAMLRMIAEQGKINPWISSTRESQINKEMIFVILSGTDDCNLIIC